MANNDEIRKMHAIMECDNQIRFYNSVLKSAKATEADKDFAKEMISEAESMKKRLQS